MNIIYVDGIVETPYDSSYPVYGDLFREIKKIHNVEVYRGHLNNLVETTNSSSKKIDLVCFGLGYFASTNNIFHKISNIDRLQAKIVCFIHKETTMLKEKLNFCIMNNVDLVIHSQFHYKKFEELMKIPTRKLMFAANPDIYRPMDLERSIDVAFTGAMHGNKKMKGATEDLRVRIGSILEPRSDLDILWGDRLPLKEYTEALNKAKIWIATTGPSGDISPRYFEIMHSKALLFCNKMPHSYEGAFIDGHNCVMYENDLSDFMEKMDYYLKNASERDRIVEQAYSDAMSLHTYAARAQQFNELLGDIYKGHK